MKTTVFFAAPQTMAFAHQVRQRFMCMDPVPTNANTVDPRAWDIVQVAHKKFMCDKRIKQL